MEKGRGQLEGWFRTNVLQHAIVISTDKADQVRWDRDNAIFADVLLRADEDEEQDEGEANTGTKEDREDTVVSTNALGIPLGSHSGHSSRSHSQNRKPPRSKLFPCHRAMLIRSDFFLTMFSSTFREAQPTPHLQIISIACSPAVLEIILSYLYTEKADFPLSIAVDVLFAADLLFLEKLKMRAAVVISTLGNGTASTLRRDATNDGPDSDEEAIDIYEILRAAWSTRVQRLEEFAARYIAYRLEAYIDDPAFAEMVKESAGRISARQETDSIELLDDIRWYLSERFRLRFEDAGLEDMMDEQQQPPPPPQQEQEQDQEKAPAQPPQHGQVADEQTQTLYIIPHRRTEPVPLQHQPQPQSPHSDECKELPTHAPAPTPATGPEAPLIITHPGAAVRTLDGQVAGDEFATDAINYQILLGRIDRLLERLELDA